MITCSKCRLDGDQGIVFCGLHASAEELAKALQCISDSITVKIGSVTFDEPYLQYVEYLRDLAQDALSHAKTEATE